MIKNTIKIVNPAPSPPPSSIVAWTALLLLFEPELIVDTGALGSIFISAHVT